MWSGVDAGTGPATIDSRVLDPTSRASIPAVDQWHFDKEDPCSGAFQHVGAGSTALPARPSAICDFVAYGPESGPRPLGVHQMSGRVLTPRCAPRQSPHPLRRTSGPCGEDSTNVCASVPDGLAEHMSARGVGVSGPFRQTMGPTRCEVAPERSRSPYGHHPTRSRGCVLRLDSMPRGWTENDLRDLFAPFGTVASTFVERDANGASTRHGRVSFFADDAAHQAKRMWRKIRQTSVKLVEDLDA